MNNKIKDEATDLLFKAILSLKNEEECYNFFEDLCTVPELKAMSQRIVVAKMLTDKKVYSDIVAKTGASTATISRVNRSLIYGSDGYEMVFGSLSDVQKCEGYTAEIQQCSSGGNYCLCFISGSRQNMESL